mmetsp:Transcript_89653/g.274456  ORF Transcript_89653/g.274456 Transcript_89653/m.274456 type:complete len:241 (-) Transcript_89653:2317-3039(-)
MPSRSSPLDSPAAAGFARSARRPRPRQASAHCSSMPRHTSASRRAPSAQTAMTCKAWPKTPSFPHSAVPHNPPPRTAAQQRPAPAPRKWPTKDASSSNKGTRPADAQSISAAEKSPGDAKRYSHATSPASAASAPASGATSSISTSASSISSTTGPEYPSPALASDSGCFCSCPGTEKFIGLFCEPAMFRSQNASMSSHVWIKPEQSVAFSARKSGMARLNRSLPSWYLPPHAFSSAAAL